MGTATIMRSLRETDELLHRAALRLAEAACDISAMAKDDGRLADPWENDYESWLDATKPLLFEIADNMPYDMLVRDGNFTEFSRMLASLEGWNMFESGDRGLEIERDDEADIFASDEAARKFVRERAATDDNGFSKPGSKLHQIALALHQHQKVLQRT